MGNLKSTLTIKLIDDVSGPAGKIAGALKTAETQVKALSSAGISGRLGQQLTRLGASAADIEKVGGAWKNYAASQKLAASSSDWTRAQSGQVRAWENATITAIRNVVRAEQNLARQQQQLAARAARPVVAPREGNLGSGLLATAGAYGTQRFGRKSIVSAAEFDIGVRKQREFVDIPKDVQDSLLIPQAKRIGQDTQFTNLDVVKAQTKAMQGLPADFNAQVRAEVGTGIVENVRNYALVMEADLERSSEAIRTFLQTTNKDISSKSKALAEANRATNLMVKMAKLGGMNDEDVQQFMKFGAATGTAASLSDTSLAALGSVGRRGGLRGDELGVFVRAISSKLVAPTSKGLDALTTAGINFNDYTKMPGGLSVNNLELLQKRRFGKGLSDDQRSRLSDILEDGEVVSNRDEFTKQVSEILAESFEKKKDGKTKAQDAQKIAKMVGDFHKLSTESVDSEGLLNAIMTNPKMSIALLNALFTDKHGGKGAILASKWPQFQTDKAELDRVSNDPDFAKRKADEIMGGLGGALERAKGSVENFQLAVGQATEGLSKFTLDKAGAALDWLSNLPTPVLGTAAVGAGAGALYAGAKGFQALYGGFGLSASAVALDGSAAALSAAAARLAGGSLLGTGAGVAAGAAGAGGLTALGVAGVGAALLGGVGLAYWGMRSLPGSPTSSNPRTQSANRRKGIFPDPVDTRTSLNPRTGGSQAKVKTSLDGPIAAPGQAYAFGSLDRFASGPANGSGADVWNSGAKAITGLDQSGPAGAAGSKTGGAFKASFDAELQQVNSLIQAAVARWTGMLGGTIAGPKITPSITAPAGGAPGKQSARNTSQKLGRLIDDTTRGSFLDHEFA